VSIEGKVAPATLLDEPTLLLGGRHGSSRSNADPDPTVEMDGGIVRRLHLDDRDLAPIEGRAAYGHDGKRLQQAIGSEASQKQKHRIVHLEAGAGAVDSLPDEHDAGEAVTRQIVGKRADRLTDPVTIGKALLAFDSIRLVEAK
jgi:hypothetical protein